MHPDRGGVNSLSLSLFPSLSLCISLLFPNCSTMNKENSKTGVHDTGEEGKKKGGTMKRDNIDGIDERDAYNAAFRYCPMDDG